jgi:hypothetical protein
VCSSDLETYILIFSLSRVGKQNENKEVLK